MTAPKPKRRKRRSGKRGSGHHPAVAQHGIRTVVLGVAAVTSALSLAFLLLRPVPTATLRGDLFHAAAAPRLVVPAPVPTPQERQARRLQTRIRSAYAKEYSVDALESSLRERASLLRRSVTVNWKSDDGGTFPPWAFSLSAYPHWVLPSFDADAVHYAVAKEYIGAFLMLTPPSGITPPKDSTLLSTAETDGVLQAVADTVAEPGYVIPVEETVAAVVDRLSDPVAEVPGGSGAALDVDIRFTPGRIVNLTGRDLGPLSYLASGRSNFAGSGEGRIANVRKGLRDLIDNVLVPPGATFSFNKAVHDMAVPGWEQALAIVNGKDLVPIAGGGICQVATTVYRAALNAGFPITERANHSLYVTYYEKYGVGIDATIFPKAQDLVFVNDTDHYLLLQAYSRGFEAYVHVYGAPDGRKVALRGPFFQTNETPEVTQVLGRSMKSNEIVWLQYITRTDEASLTNVILSRYSSIPRRLKEMYAGANGGKT